MSEQEIRTFHPSSLGYLQVCPRFVNDETRDDTASKRGTMLHERNTLADNVVRYSRPQSR